MSSPGECHSTALQSPILFTNLQNRAASNPHGRSVHLVDNVMHDIDESDNSTASHLHLRTLPSPTAAPPAHNTPSQRSPLLGAVNMPSPTAADPLMQNTPSQGRRSHPRVIAIDSNSDDDSSPTPNAWVHKGPVSAEEWAEVSDLFFDDIDSQSLPDLAAGMAEVSMDNNGQRTLKASTGHSDWAHVAEELVGDAFENAREVAIRRAPVQLELTAEGATERKDRKVAYVVYHGRSVGVFYNW